MLLLKSAGGKDENYTVCTIQGVGTDADSNMLKLIHRSYYKSASGTHRDCLKRHRRLDVISWSSFTQSNGSAAHTFFA